ncbi:MAG: ABC transporter ATP-binding protein [Granulosicoccus sp.]
MLESGSVSLLELTRVHTHYPGVNGKPPVQAVSNVSFSLEEGEVLGIVGESGCGKSTLARSVLRLCECQQGRIEFDSQDITRFGRRQMKAIRRQMQVVFQDPFGSLNPRHSVNRLLTEPLRVHAIGDAQTQQRRVKELLSLVGLSESALSRLPHEFSGGQRQRIAIARALSLQPRLLIMDEAVSALDVSVQSQIINLINELRSKMDLSMLFISHDLSVVRHVSDRVAVMYLGHIIETGPTELVMNSPIHPYTQALVSAIPGWQRTSVQRIVLQGEMPDPSRPPSGCVFSTRCTHAVDKCFQQRPELLSAKVRQWPAEMKIRQRGLEVMGEHRHACFLDLPNRV